MQILQTMKDNPWMTLITSSGSIFAVVAALFAIDERYAHAADVSQYNTQTTQTIRQTADSLRKQMLEDKIFELDVKKSMYRDGKLPPVEQAIRDRYQRQLDEITIKKPQ